MNHINMNSTAVCDTDITADSGVVSSTARDDRNRIVAADGNVNIQTVQPGSIPIPIQASHPMVIRTARLTVVQEYIARLAAI